MSKIERVDVPSLLDDVAPSEEPGLGVSYDEEAAWRFPYEPKYLPVARRLDGSVHDW